MSSSQIDLKALSSEQRVALERQLLAQIKGRKRDIPRRESVRPCPLSFAQQRLWFLEQMEGDLAAYNIPGAWRLKGRLHTRALQRALEEIVRRHESIRTTFTMLADEPVQRIGPVGQFALRVDDLSSFQESSWDAEIAHRCRLEAERPFDLTTDVMLRGSLLRLAEEDHVLLLTMHHIASDGWSMRVLWRKLGNLYAAYCNGDDSRLPNLPVQYSDYATWQREQLQGERLEKQLQYWRKQLDGVTTLELPTDRHRPAVLTYRGEQLEFEWKQGLIERLKSLCQTEGATLHMTLLAAFQIVLMRYSGLDDIAVGTPIAGRNHAQLEDLIGFFVNTLVLRSDLSGNPTFRELLSRVRQTSLAAYDHQTLPFEKLIENLQPERQLNRSPLIQVVFQLMNLSAADLSLQGLEVSRLPRSGGRARFDLEMHLSQTSDAIRGTVVYSTDLFDRTNIERLVGHYTTLLEGIAADADRRIGDLPLLTEPERRQVLSEWNGTSVEYPHERCVHELFEQQVERTPEAISVVFEGREWSYRELNQRANRLAHYLRELGVGPDAPVGLCVRRSPELIVAILGILKAGGAYVPFEVDYPRPRLEYMLRDSHIRCLITETELLDRLPSGSWRPVRIDSSESAPMDGPIENLKSDVNSRNLAYLMYTSGSTGQPKGVTIEHRSITRLVMGSDYVALGSDRVFLQLAPVAFDASTFEIWGALLHGAKLVLAPNGMPDLTDLDHLIERHGVTTLWLTASLFNQIVEQRPEMLGRVREILTGGEALSVSHVRMAQKTLGPHVQLINGYGPTENTTFSCCYRISFGLPADARSVPIGRPIANTRAFVLDSQGQPVPIGIPGELYLGGDGLARGYFNRPELTAERFVECPFEPGQRLYRTGDRVSWRADGMLEFHGRFDDQVKIRGYRIELGEIETALARHPTVGKAIVTAREDQPGDKFLAAYVVPRDGQAMNSKMLRAHLQKTLPAYMVPTFFVSLEELPLSANGKVNRQALPTPEFVRDHLEQPFMAPQTAQENSLARIWAEELGIERVGVHDNFFELGGHSLLASRVLTRFRNETGTVVPLAAIFRAPTIASLTDLIDEPLVASRDLIQPVQTTGFDTPIFWFGHTAPIGFLKEQFARRHPIYWGKPQHVDGRRVRYEPLEVMAHRYLNQIREICPAGPYILGGFSFHGLLAFEVARQFEKADAVSPRLFLVEPSSPKSPGATTRTRRRQTGGMRNTRPPFPLRLARRYWRSVHRWVHSFYCAANLRVGLPVPLSMRWDYASKRYKSAIRQYSPQPFQGNVILVHGDSKAHSAQMHWEQFIAGQVSICPINCSDHVQLVEDPVYCKEWINGVRSRLEQAASKYQEHPGHGIPSPHTPFTRHDTTGDATQWRQNRSLVSG